MRQPLVNMMNTASALIQCVMRSHQGWMIRDCAAAAVGSVPWMVRGLLITEVCASRGTDYRIAYV